MREISLVPIAFLFLNALIYVVTSFGNPAEDTAIFTYHMLKLLNFVNLTISAFLVWVLVPAGFILYNWYKKGEFDGVFEPIHQKEQVQEPVVTSEKVEEPVVEGQPRTVVIRDSHDQPHDVHETVFAKNGQLTIADFEQLTDADKVIIESHLYPPTDKFVEHLDGEVVS